MISLKELQKSPLIPPDNWELEKYDQLSDLDFQCGGDLKLDFTHEDEVYGKKKYLKLTVYRTPAEWCLESQYKKDDQTQKESFKTFSKLINRIHEIFQKS